MVIKLLSSQDSYRGSFRFDKRMLQKPLVKEAIQMAWNSPDYYDSSSVSSRLCQCRKALSQWKKDNLANSQVRIINFQELEQEQSSLDPSTLRMVSLKKDLLLAYRDEENFWKQKSKDDWILYGDGNTEVVHAAVKISRAKNEIVKFFDKDGNTQRLKLLKVR